jgi:ketosteroid isomerase-like protein
MGAANGTWADERAIIDLTVAYAWALDTRQFADLRQVFAEDAVGDLAGQHCEGLDAITARIERPLSRLDVTQHVVTNHQVTVDGDTATCRCYLVGQHVKKGTDGGDTFIMAGVYDDELRRTADGWRIVHRTLTVTWTDGNPAVIGR